MKKIIALLAIVGMFSFQGCTTTTDSNYVDNDTISEVFEVTMDFTSTNNYLKIFPLSPKIYSGDNLLVYELRNMNDGIDTWALLPQVYYFPQGTAQYNFSFSYDQFNILIDGSFPFAQLPSSFTTNKTFRIVIVPGDDGINTGGPNSKLLKIKEDYSDYYAVIAKYKIDDSNVKKLN